MSAKKQATVPITVIDFPHDFASLKAKCSEKISSNLNLRPFRSRDLGQVQIITIPKSHSETSTDYSNSTSTPVVERFERSATISTSIDLGDTKHKTSVKPTMLQFKRPCEGSALFGVPEAQDEKCQTKEKKKFNLTEDPRKNVCFKEPQMTKQKPMSKSLELTKIKELIKTAENVVPMSESHSSESSICEEMDLLNPLGLDFQGTDFKNTYERDEQNSQNQIEYLKIKRVQNRKQVKAETAYNTQLEQHMERIAIPKVFNVQPKPLPRLSRSSAGKKKMRLVRSDQKPEVAQKLKDIEVRRKERYKDLYIRSQKKKEEDHEKEIEDQKRAEDEKPAKLAEEDIEDFVNLLDRVVLTKWMDIEPPPERKQYPHNIVETVKFQRNLKKSKRVLRDRAIVTQDFYRERGYKKNIPEAKLEISPDASTVSSLGDEQSSNDEDDLVVGQQGSKFLLRGFCYKQGPNLRGKFHQKDRNLPYKVKGCITRNEWFESLNPTKTQKVKETHTEMNLFPPQKGLKKLYPKSAIRDYQSPEWQKKIRSRRRLRIKKPKTLKVKKFNLIGYMYGASRLTKPVKTDEVEGTEAQAFLGSTLEYIKQKAERKKLKKKMQRQQRMRYLGIPIPEEKPVKQKSCVDSESEESGWIPDDKSSEEILSPNIEMRLRGNMPAPEYRESTLRRNPRHARDYELLRVPSAQLDQFVANNHVPVLRKLEEDKKFVQNIRTVKDTEYSRIFDTRHHHEHWNPVQHKSVNVLYSRKIVKPKPLQERSDPYAKYKKGFKIFDKAHPVDSDVEEKDFPKPKIDIDEIIKNHQNQSKGDTKGQKSKVQKIKQRKAATAIHSLPEGEYQEFPGREKFLEFIQEIKTEMDKRSNVTGIEGEINKSEFINELKEDLRSIESCLSSLSSSDCTTLSQNSGSFLMTEEKNIPLDYFRKSVVPFEELNRPQVQAIPIDTSKKDETPYLCVPFAGQKKEQLAMTAAKENFFTFNTRLQNGMRQRLEVQSESPRKKLLGPKRGPFAIAQVATDIDELYIEDIKRLPRLKLFKFNSCRTMLKDALRKKFETMLIQGEIVRTKINDRRNEENFQLMMSLKEMFEKLFDKWEKKEYEDAMEAVNKVKPYYEATDVYRREHQELSKHYMLLNMEIVYIENDWRHLTILQNFHYLLADLEWRVQHDWIHREPDGSLEGYRESIAKRGIVNLRQRDKDDAWAIKEYYEKTYLQNYHPVLIVFSNPKEFIDGIDNLKTKTFVLLLELQYTLWTLAELEQRYHEFDEWCKIELESKKKFGERKCANKYFMEDRVQKLQNQMENILIDPINETFGDKRISELKGICNEVYKDVVPVGDQMELSTLEQVGAISMVLDNLMAQLENIPVQKRIRVEKKYRRMLAYRRNLSRQAVFIERRIASEIVKVKRNMAPPFVKPPRVGKLPRSVIKKKVIPKKTKPKSVVLSEEAAFLYKAFHDEEVPEEGVEVQPTQQNIIPFYFDHFLKINGYTPCYDFKTQIEERDGNEYDLLQVKKLIPVVMDKVIKWEQANNRIMDENISKNPHMYQNVQI